jgi:hypothetical protein
MNKDFAPSYFTFTTAASFHLMSLTEFFCIKYLNYNRFVYVDIFYDSGGPTELDVAQND